MTRKAISLVVYASPDLIPAEMKRLALLTNGAALANLLELATVFFAAGDTLPSDRLRHGGVFFGPTDTIPGDLLRVGGFEVADLSGLICLLDAGKITGLLDDNPITTWADVSGSANDVTQATEANRPLYKTNIFNGKPAVRFDGSNDLLANTMAIGASATVFVVAQFTGASAGGATVIDDDSGNRMRLFRQSATSMRASSISELAITTTPQSPHIYSIIYTATGEFRVDGGGVQTGDISSTKEGLSIGALPSGTAPANVDVAEVIVFNRALNANDRQAIETFLGWKYAIAL